MTHDLVVEQSPFRVQANVGCKTHIPTKYTKWSSAHWKFPEVANFHYFVQI